MEEPNLERAVRGVLAHPVEDDNATGTPKRDEARKPVDQLAPVIEGPRVEDVVAVEEVEHEVRMPGSVERYLAELASRVLEVLGAELVGVYVGGSWALGDYEQGRSDLDISAVARTPTPRALA